MNAYPWEPRLAHLEGAFEQLDKRLGDFMQQVDARFAQVDTRFAQVDARFAQVDARFAQVDARFEGVERKIDDVRRLSETHFRWLVGLIVVSILLPIAARLVPLH